MRHAGEGGGTLLAWMGVQGVHADAGHPQPGLCATPLPKWSGRGKNGNAKQRGWAVRQGHSKTGQQQQQRQGWQQPTHLNLVSRARSSLLSSPAAFSSSPRSTLNRTTQLQGRQA